MIANQKRTLKPGTEYNAIMPPANGGIELRHKRGSTDDGVRLMQKVTRTTLRQTRVLAQRLRGASLTETCRNIWNFVYEHIQYEKDRPGKEDIRHPARSWADRVRGVDCDDYSVFIGSILMNLGIPYKFRITAYGGDWQHVYVIVPDGSGHITIDCVVNNYNEEVPYTKKKDVDMIPTYELSGLPEDLGRTKKRQARIDTRKAKKVEYRAAQTPGQQVARKRKTIFGKALQKIGRGVAKVGAASVRSAWLMAMKINFKRVATRLRWAYATPELAARNGINASQYQAIRNQLLKIQNVFFKVGGNASNLKNAILKGAGNKDKKVSLGGFNGMGTLDHEYENLPTIEQLAGMGSIDPVTLTALGVIMTALVELSKNLNGILPANNAEGYTPDYQEEKEYEYYSDGYEGIGKIKLFAKKKGKNEPSKPLVSQPQYKMPVLAKPLITPSSASPLPLPAVVIPPTSQAPTKKEVRKEKKVVWQANRIEKRADRKVKKVPANVSLAPELVAKAQDVAILLSEKQASGQKLNMKERRDLVKATAISKKAVAVAQNPDLARSKKQVRLEKRATRKIDKKPITTNDVSKAQNAQTILTEKVRTGKRLNQKEQRDLATANSVLKVAASKPDTVLDSNAVVAAPVRRKVTVSSVLNTAGNVIQKVAAVSNTAQDYNERVQQVITPGPVYSPTNDPSGGYAPYEEVASGAYNPNAPEDVALTDSLVPEGTEQPKTSSTTMLLWAGAAAGIGYLLFGGDQAKQKRTTPSKTKSSGMSGVGGTKSSGMSGVGGTKRKQSVVAPMELW